MIEQHIAPGTSFSGSGRLIVPPYLAAGVAPYAAYALGSDYDLDAGRDITGNDRNAVFYNGRPGASGFVSGGATYAAAAYAELPFSGADLIAAGGGGFSMAAAYELATGANGVVVGNFVDTATASASLYAETDNTSQLVVIQPGASNPIGSIKSPADASRGSHFTFLGGVFAPQAFTIGYATSGQALTTTAAVSTNANMTGGTQLMRIGLGFDQGALGLVTNTLVVFYAAQATAADLATIRNWMKVELSKEGIAL